jgi:hypothetical protein
MAADPAQVKRRNDVCERTDASGLDRLLGQSDR